VYWTSAGIPGAAPSTWDGADVAAQGGGGPYSSDVECSVGRGDGGAAVSVNVTRGVSGSLLVRLPTVGAPSQVTVSVRGLVVSGNLKCLCTLSMRTSERVFQERAPSPGCGLHTVGSSVPGVGCVRQLRLRRGPVGCLGSSVGDPTATPGAWRSVAFSCCR
jgi:hypothetical protein